MNLASPKNFSGAKLFRENDVIRPYAQPLSQALSSLPPERGCHVLCTGTPNSLSVIKINVLLFTFVRVCFESFRRDLNEVKAVYISVMKINVLLFTFVRVFFEYCYLSLLVSFSSHLEGI